MSLTFIEVGDECSQHSFNLTLDNKILLDNSITLNISSVEKEENIVKITTEKFSGDFGEHDECTLNYFYLYLIIDTLKTDGSINFGSKIVYGYNKENSYIDYLTQPLITVKLYEKFKVRFDISYGQHMNVLPVFLKYMFEKSTNHTDTYKALNELVEASYPVKELCKPLEKVSLNRTYNWLIVRNTEKQPNFLEDILTAILEEEKQQVFTFYSPNKTDLKSLEKVDVIIVINSDETVTYEVPKGTYCYTCPDAFYQSSRRLFRNLPKVVEWCMEHDIPDRTVSITELAGGKTEGGCGGCNKEGGCCKEKKFDEVSEEVIVEEIEEKKGGCCQGKTSGCCKSPTATEEDKSKCGTGSCSGACKGN